MQSAALSTAKAYEKEALERIRRISIASAELEVKGQRKQSSIPIGLGGPSDSMLEDTSPA
jgi:COP9 signalosome complex subunit 1